MPQHGFKAPPTELLTPATLMLLAEVDEVWVSNEPKVTAGISIVKGKITLLLGTAYHAADPVTQAEILKHECGHFASDHAGRRGDRQHDPWNAVCDAAIHACGVADPNILREGIRRIPGFEGFEPVVFERITDKHGRKLFPMPPEAAYELLPTVVSQSGCGSPLFSDETPESIARRAVVATGMFATDKQFRDQIFGSGAGKESGTGRSTPELPRPPRWIRHTIEYLVRTQERTMRARSWRREHRASPWVMPGVSRSFSKGAVFFLDASGSIPDKDLALMASAVTLTPELSGSLAVVFDSTSSDYIPVIQAPTLVKELRKRGGGTAIAQTGIEKRLPHLPAVWITDGYTGDGWPPPHVHHEIWCINTDVTPPFGITIRVDKE